jgi:hypothetical protein
MKWRQKTITCPNCGTKITLRARQLASGDWKFTGFKVLSDGRARTMCLCGNLIKLSDDDLPATY